VVMSVQMERFDEGALHSGGNPFGRYVCFNEWYAKRYVFFRDFSHPHLSWSVYSL